MKALMIETNKVKDLLKTLKMEIAYHKTIDDVMSQGIKSIDKIKFKDIKVVQIQGSYAHGLIKGATMGLETALWLVQSHLGAYIEEKKDEKGSKDRKKTR